MSHDKFGKPKYVSNFIPQSQHDPHMQQENIAKQEQKIENEKLSKLQQLAHDSSYVSTHPQHKLLMLKIKARANIYVVGPTGSGKTQGIKVAGNELGLQVYKKLMGNQTSEASIIGYMDAGGRYVEGLAYKPFTQGGILCLDEIDNGNPNTTLVANGLADREFAFPCGMREAHKDFVLVATANTIGTGANIQYCGRNRLDMAMLNRFEFVNWEYNDELEELLMYRFALANAPEFDLGKIHSLYLDIHYMRKSIEDQQLQHIISPRNSIQATVAFVTGQSPTEIFHSILLKGLDKDTKKKVFEAAKAKRKELKNDIEESPFTFDKVKEAVNNLLAIVGDTKPTSDITRMIQIIRDQKAKEDQAAKTLGGYKKSYLR